MDTVFIILQYLLPQHLLSRLTGALARCEITWVKNPLIELFAKHFNVDMSEAADPELRNYPNFNAFFTRALKDGARPIDAEEGYLVQPADGAISQLGDIKQGRIFQAKGQSYTAEELLGGDSERAAAFSGGKFATIYLSPKDYHRLHMPLAGKLAATTYVLGQLFSVNQVTAENVPRLFARNDRLVCHFDTEAGPMAMVLVGAMIVAGIETVWGGQVAPPPKTPQTFNYDNSHDIHLERGAEMGRFKLGSTVVLLFPENSVEWLEQYQAGTPTRMGEKLAKLG